MRAPALALMLMVMAGLAPAGARAAEGGSPRVAFFVNGALGDKSFFDSAARGLRQAEADLHLATRTIEGGYDPTRWESGLVDLADSGDFPIIVTGTYTMGPLVQKVAPDYPDVTFILFDGVVDYAHCACGNVYSMRFRQNEGGYLAGVLAAGLARAGTIPGAGEMVGLVGAMPIPVINDFAAGYGAGAQDAAPGITVLRQFANSFSDPATGKEIAEAQYGQGAGVIFQVAGATGQGVIEAAEETGRYVIGVDSDQAALYRASSPRRAARILTSVMKNVDAAILRALRLWQQGRLPLGRTESLGLKEGAIGLADNPEAALTVPPTVRAAVAAARQRIIDGTLTVPTAFAGGQP
ncbi:BMP family lipoprotein [Nitrospirillum viridazoti]|uniref:BMP family ABC transporter substrate-binding protein n=1 Tax=Nitrospirillum viridazoti CBAmc TaxID=1441467 RepID=A0A248JPV1_9PROT|nr:BMP family ABC transporter substrate-binding protein [Nitrospirillum amazonense]ASG20264.1 BMP family ABC transporter substrate-binding protein [Nitrospirillum amazonense CBAmc]TWB27976.1 nucleoside-binding protein [Nitrospirillum amazonense]